MTAEQIADLLRAHPSGAGFLARCPAHEDRSPSLSIREGETGRVLLHCFSGCSVEAICSAMGIRVSNLFSKPGAYQPTASAVREAQKQIQNLRSRITRREQVLPITVVYCNPEDLDAGIVRALALAVEGELVQVVLEDHA